MERKTPITRSSELLRQAQLASDVERLNASAERLNREMSEVLELQSPPPHSE